MNYCCDYVFWCPTRQTHACFVHGTITCCDREDLHECVTDLYPFLGLGDGYTCWRCGNYEVTGVRHEPATRPGFPRKTGPARTGSVLDDPPDP